LRPWIFPWFDHGSCTDPTPGYPEAAGAARPGLVATGLELLIFNTLFLRYRSRWREALRGRFFNASLVGVTTSIQSSLSSYCTPVSPPISAANRCASPHLCRCTRKPVSKKFLSFECVYGELSYMSGHDRSDYLCCPINLSLPTVANPQRFLTVQVRVLMRF
jgi:hypothetical protein